MDWFRSWHGAPTDLKWPVVAAHATVLLGGQRYCNVTTVTSVTWALLDFASQNSPRGSVTGFSVEGYAMYGGVDAEIVRTIIVALHDKEVLKDNAFVNWVKRQSSESAERVRRFRERQKQDDNVTCNARNVTVTKIRGDKIKKESTPIVPKTPSSWTYTEDFERLWNSWRPFEMSKGGKGESSKSYAKAISSGASSSVLEKAAIAYCRNCERLKSKTQHLSTWLNQRGWEGVEEPAPKSFYDNPMNRMPSPAGG